MNDTRVAIFCSYSHKDEAYRKTFETILDNLKHTNLIDVWHDRMIPAGSDWAGQIDDNLNRSDIVVLFVSADFLASNYCYDKEMGRALEREALGETIIMPMIVRSCDWEDAPFKRFQMIPKGAKPIAKWKYRDDAWTDVSIALKATIRSVLAKKLSKLQAAAIHYQIARDAPAQQAERARIMAELTTRIFDITSDIGPPVRKGIKKAGDAFKHIDD